MQLILIGDLDLLERLIPELYASPEDFLIYIEELIETGQYDLDEIRQLIHDYNRRG